MSVLDVRSPGTLSIFGGSGPHFQTQFVTNPWANQDAISSPVFILCTMNYATGTGQTDFGILEIESLDNLGHLHRERFVAGNPDDIVYGELVAVRFEPRLVSVTVAAHTYDGGMNGTVTLFLLG